MFGFIFVSTWCGNQFSPLLLLYQQRQHYSALTVNLFLGVYVLGLAPALLVAGALSDQHGRRPVMTAGVLCALAASLCLTFGSAGPAAIYLGRLLSGITVGVAMSVGTSWLKELSQPPHDPHADAGSGARRASLAFSLGSGIGALVAGAIAQWGPWPEQLPFLIHLGVTLPFLSFLPRLPETSVTGGLGGSLLAQLRVPAAGHQRFRKVVVPAAPWVFAAAGLGYGYLPVLLSNATGRWGLAYATLLTVITLGTSALVQPWAKRIDSRDSARGLVATLTAIAAGIALVAVAYWQDSVWLGIAAGFVLGIGIGFGLVSGLLEVQRIAGPADLAGLTGMFYAVAYIGFLTPAVLAGLSSVVPTMTLFIALIALVVVCCLGVLASYRKHLPAPAQRTPVTTR